MVWCTFCWFKDSKHKTIGFTLTWCRALCWFKDSKWPMSSSIQTELANDTWYLMWEGFQSLPCWKSYKGTHINQRVAIYRRVSVHLDIKVCLPDKEAESHQRGREAPIFKMIAGEPKRKGWNYLVCRKCTKWLLRNPK